MYTVGKDNVSPSAAKLIDVAFNAASDAEVTELKMLAARIVTIMEPYQADRQNPNGCARLASIAITEIEKASTITVKAVTRKFQK